MCLIIAPGADGKAALLPREVFDYSYTRNNDGFGAMWTEDGRVQHLKVLGLSRDAEYEKMEELVAAHPDVIFHMRLKTHGKVIPSLCHPFRILHKSRHGKDLFFMHNGVLSGYGNSLSYGQSDTTNFKDKILIPLLTRNPNALDDPDIWRELNRMTSGSRLIFLDSNGVVKRTSETAWNNRYGLTLSNTYMLPSEVQTHSNVVSFPSEGTPVPNSSKSGYPMWRQIQPPAGQPIYGCWFREVIPGIIRSEYGTLYYDHGVNNVLSFNQDYIAEEDEIEAITAMQANNDKKAAAKTTYNPSVDDLMQAVDDLDDELPWKDDVKDGAPASKEEQLRYARIVHNCHDGDAVSRINLIADILSMGNKELFGFIKEDPDNAATVVAELLEIVIDQNDMLREDPTCEDYTWDYDELTELGSGEHHQASMKMISDARKKHYAELAAQVAAMEEAKKAEAAKPVEVKDKAKQNKKQRKAA